MLNKLLFISFLLLVFSLGFTYPIFNFSGARLSITDFCFLLTFSLWILTLITGSRKFNFDRIFIFLALYALAALLSTVFSANVFHSSIRYLGIIYLIFLPVLCINLIENAEDFRKVFLAWLSGTFLSLVIGLLAFFLFYFQRDNWLLNYITYHYGAVPVGNYPRLSSTFISASMFCNYLNASLLIAFIGYNRKWINKPLFYFFCFAVVFCSIFTISSGLGAIFLSIGIWVWFLLRNKQKLLAGMNLAAAILIGLGFLLLNVVALQKHVTSPYTIRLLGMEFSPSPRLIVWQESSLTFFNNFVFGKGLGENSCHVTFQNTDGTFSVLTDAHNMFLSVASQCGILGLSALIFLLIYIFKQKNNNAVGFGLWVAILSSFIYQGLIGSFEDTRHIWVLIGLFIASHSIFISND